MRRVALAVLSTAAAYTPIPSIELSDRGPARAPAITSSLTQPSGQTANKTISAHFPPEFTYNPDFDVAGCTPADEQAATCPPESKLGTMSVQSAFGPAEGPVHLMTDLRLVGFLDAYGGLVTSRVIGTVSVADDRGAVVTFDDLPNIPVTSSTIALEGGKKATLMTPRRCGTYRVRATLISQQGEKVEQALPIRIEGCPAHVAIRRPRYAGGVLRWATSEPARTEVLVLRRDHDDVWRQVRSWRTAATSLRLPRSLPSGAYRAILRAVTEDGRASPARSVRFAVG